MRGFARPKPEKMKRLYDVSPQKSTSRIAPSVCCTTFSLMKCVTTNATTVLVVCSPPPVTRESSSNNDNEVVHRVPMIVIHQPRRQVNKLVPRRPPQLASLFRLFPGVRVEGERRYNITHPTPTPLHLAGSSSSLLFHGVASERAEVSGWWTHPLVDSHSDQFQLSRSAGDRKWQQSCICRQTEVYWATTWWYPVLETLPRVVINFIGSEYDGP